MNTVKERLKAYLSSIDISQAEFGRRIGVSGAFVTSMRKSIQPDKLEKIKDEFPNLNIDWLLTGEGEMAPNSSSLQTTTKDEDDALWLPVINLDTRGGLLPNNEVDTVQFNAAMMPFSRNIARMGDFVMPVIGDSMTPKYPNGTYVLVRPLPTWREYIELGATYVLELLDGRRVIKDVRAGHDFNHFNLCSVNPTFDPTEIAKDFINNIFAVIMSVRRELNW